MKTHAETAAVESRAVGRREFVQSLALAGASLAAGGAARALAAGGAAEPKATAGAPRIKLGMDNFAVRAMEWKAPALLDYAASIKLDSILISDLDAFERFDRAYLQDVKARAADRGVQIHVGTWSICPTSTSFKNKWGTAEEHLALGIRVAKDLGSPVIRCILGRGDDRRTPGGIDARIADTVKVCKSQRSRALDAGVKIAVENHAGDMQAWELVRLIEEAGREYMGACMDSGNAAWTMEDPLENLEILGPYTATTSLRDSAIWESEHGATVQWTAMGEGTVDVKRYFQRYAELCPQVPVHIETISGFNREIPYLDADFWQAFPKARARDFARFLALAKRGKPRAPYQAPQGSDPRAAEQAYQKAELERSIKFCKESLHLGLKS